MPEISQTLTQRRKFVFPDLYYQHGDDGPLSINIQNNRKISLRDKLILERIGNFRHNSIRSISFLEYTPVIFEDLSVFFVTLISGNCC